MPNLLTRLFGGRSPAAETKSTRVLMQLRDLGDPDWTRRSFPALAQAGFMRNPVVHRCVRLIAESAARVPMVVHENGQRLSEHPPGPNKPPHGTRRARASVRASRRKGD